MQKTNKDTVVDEETGEILNKRGARTKIQKEALENTKKSNEELRRLGLAPNLKLEIVKRAQREYQTVKIKENHEFNKVFRVDLREVMQNQGLGKNARLAVGTLIGFITFPTNLILVDGKAPSNEDLEKLLGLSPVTIKKTLNELEKHEVIKRVKEINQRLIYFNPFLVCAGGVVDVNTYSLFKDSLFNNDGI